MKYRFTHPTQEDFLRTVNEVAGEDLNWYWQQAVYGTQVLDYKVLKAESTRVDWADKNAPDEKKGETLYETNVLLQRVGDFILPVTAEIKFDNGQTIRERWVGVERWKRFVYLKKAKVLSVEIDPDHQITMVRNYLNNSVSTESHLGAVAKISACWMFLTQFLAQMLAWLVLLSLFAVRCSLLACSESITGDRSKMREERMANGAKRIPKGKHGR